MHGSPGPEPEFLGASSSFPWLSSPAATELGVKPRADSLHLTLSELPEPFVRIPCPCSRLFPQVRQRFGRFSFGCARLRGWRRRQ